MTALAERLKSLIAANGPISVADYIAACLFDPEHGYYTTREPFGAEGDFTTAPEISQMFGELVAVWALSTWTSLGELRPFVLAEIGPGRGTLMKDVLRTLLRLRPDLSGTMQVGLIEVSPRLREIQRQTLATLNVEPTWHDAVDTLPELPLILVGNELFDAVPIRQYVRAEGRWRERMVALDDNDDLAFVLGLGQPDASLLPQNVATAPDGSIVEIAPARSAIMATIAAHLAYHGGAALFPDYGYLQPGLGDTLQALRRHAFDDALAAPGEADLTAHVDFASLTTLARNAGLHVETTTQGEFLLALGLLERAGSLGATMDEAGREAISAAVERLAAPDQMGNLFKVMGVASRPISMAGFTSNGG